MLGSENSWKTYADLMVGRILGVVLDWGVSCRRRRRHKLRASEDVEVAEDILVAALHLVHVLVVALLAENKKRQVVTIEFIFIIYRINITAFLLFPIAVLLRAKPIITPELLTESTNLL